MVGAEVTEPATGRRAVCLVETAEDTPTSAGCSPGATAPPPLTWPPPFRKAPGDLTVLTRSASLLKAWHDAGVCVAGAAPRRPDGASRPQLSTLAELLPKFIALWKQIADAFAGYGDEIILHGLNEPRVGDGIGDQTIGTRDVRCAINALNHAFVHTVRACGGNNTTRWLCVPPFGARTLPECLSDMIIPEDDKVILTIHSYYPERFCFDHPGKESTPVFDPTCEQELRQVFQTVENYAVPHNVPIIMTEFGAVTKRMPDGKTRNDAERVKFVKAHLAHADRLGIPCVWWDDNYYDAGDEWFGLYDRETLTCNSPDVASALLEAAAKE